MKVSDKGRRASGIPRVPSASRLMRRVLLTIASVFLLVLGFGPKVSYNGALTVRPLNHLTKRGMSMVDGGSTQLAFGSDALSEKGVVFFIHAEDQAKDLYDPLCVVAQQRAKYAGEEDSDEGSLPVALQDITIARSSTVPQAAIRAVVDSVANNERCFEAPSLDVAARDAARRRFSTSVSVSLANGAFSRRPLLAVSIHGDPLHLALATSFAQVPMAGYPSTTWISMPHEDLASSGWILTLPPEAVQAWHTPIWKLIVITNDRVVSLRRLLKSLKTAHYYGDAIDLQVKADALADDETVAEVLRVADQYSPVAWPHGTTHVNHRFRQAGLITNIVEAWYPASDHEYAFFFEDDIEASPYFFAWAKYAILLYRYGPERETKLARDLYGVSLYQAKTSELDPTTGRVLWNATAILRDNAAQPDARHFPEHTPFLLQVPCSWGAVYFPQHWREFHRFLIERERSVYAPEAFKIVWPKVVSNGWHESWKRYLIELVFMRGYQQLYPNYPNFTSLSTNHVELGQHIDHVKQANLKPLQFLPLMQDDEILRGLPGGALTPLEDLPAFDLWGSMTDEATLYELGWTRQNDMFGCDTLPGVAPLERQQSDYNATTLLGCLGRPMSAVHNETVWTRMARAKQLAALAPL